MSSQSKKSTIASRFEHAVQLPDSVLHQEIGKRLLARLELVKLAPMVVLDLGCGDGQHAKALQKHYPSALLIAIDRLVLQAERAAQQKTGWWRRLRAVAADATQQPLADASVDLVFSNLMLHWPELPTASINEITRVLSPTAPLMFSCYGPDTLLELRSLGLDLPQFVDMHDIGDDLVVAGLGDPVMEMEKLYLKYTNSEQLCLDLQSAGLLLKHDKDALVTAQVVEQQADFTLTIEVIYGHAWKPDKMPNAASFKGIEIKPG